MKPTLPLLTAVTLGIAVCCGNPKTGKDTSTVRQPLPVEVHVPNVPADTLPKKDTVAPEAVQATREENKEVSVKTTKEETPDSVWVRHRWKDLDTALFLGSAPSQEEISQWKKDFESANPVALVSSYTLRQYRSMDRYLAIVDFDELLHGPRYEEYPSDDRRLLWRLDQYDPLVKQKPRSDLGKILHIRSQYESILDYGPYSMLDHALWATISVDYRNLYDRTLDRELRSRTGAEVSKELEEEFRCEQEYYVANSKAFVILQGHPVWSGTLFPYLAGRFGNHNIDMGIMAKEEFLRALLDTSYTVNPKGSTTILPIQVEYALFAGELKEEEEREEREEVYGYPLKEKCAVLEEDEQAFVDWMDARFAVSQLLSGQLRTSYDNATAAIIKEKLRLLKMRYDVAYEED